MPMLMQQVPAVIWTTDRDLRITSALGAGLSALGLKPEEFVGVSLHDYEQSADPSLPPVSAAVRALAGESSEVVVDWRGHSFQAHIEPLRGPGGNIAGTVGIALDITDRRRVEEALRVSQARIAGIVDISEDAIISIDEGQRITLFNRGAEAIFGYSADEVLGKPLDLLLPPRFQRAHGAQVRAFSRSGDALRPMNERGEIVGLRKDGTEFPAEASISKFEVGGEKILNVRLRDISERKRFESELSVRASQQAAVAKIGQQALQQSGLDALMQTACELVARTLDVEFCKVLELLPGGTSLLLRAGVGWSVGLVGKAILSAGTGSHSGYTLLSTGPVIIEDLRTESRFSEPLLHQHGIVSGMSVIILAQDRAFGVLGAYSSRRREFSKDDVNFLQAVANVLAAAIGRHETEEELRQSNEALSVVNQASPVAIWSMDLDGNVKFWNPAAERTFGWSEEELLNRPLPIAPQEAEFQQLMARCRRGEPVAGVETRRRTKDGRSLEVGIWSAPLRDRSGAIRGTLVVAADITERKRLEEQLRFSQKLESIGLLAGGVAHDFNNLLTGIMGNLSLALDVLPPASPARTMLETSMRAGQSAADLVRQLLAYSGKGRFVIQPVDLSAVVRELVTLLRTSIPKNVNLELRLEEGLPPVEGDVSQLQQVIMNLVINGAEAIGEDTGTVTITTRAQELKADYIRANFLEEFTPGTYVCLEMRDTGSGMDERTKAQIFEPFFSTKFTGRGLGLAAVSGIVRGHKGAIRVVSAPGKGSTFKVFFPAANARLRENRTRVQEELAGAGAVLVVDDEEIVRQTAKAALERYGYTVLTAENGREALNVLEGAANPVIAILLDLSMPVMGGEETLRHLGKMHPGIPVILTSGYSEMEAIRRFAHSDAAAFLQKPFTAAELARKVKDTARRRTGAGGAG